MVTTLLNGFRKEAGEKTGHSPPPAWSTALGGVKSPSSLLSFVLHHRLFLQPAVGILGGPGLPVLWRERWAHPTGQAESSWVVDVRSFLFLSIDQAGGLGQQMSFQTLEI